MKGGSPYENIIWENMLRYSLKRLAMMIPVIIGISFIIFMIMSLTPGDPAQLILGADADPVVLEKKRQELGLTGPVLLRYIKYMIGLLQGDLGNSFRTGLPVLQELLGRLSNTIYIAFGGIGLSVLIGVPLGVLSAVYQYKFIDYFSRTFALLLTAIPGFWLGLILLLNVSLKWGLLPATGVGSWKNFVMPIMTLGAMATATVTRTTRSSMLEVIRQDYVSTAKAKGVPKGRLIKKHIVRNGILPVITIVGMNIGVHLGGTVVIENVFAIPGMGALLVDSVRVKDIPLVVGSVVLISIFISFSNLIVDIVYSYLDPRIKTKLFGDKKRRVTE